MKLLICYHKHKKVSFSLISLVKIELAILENGKCGISVSGKRSFHKSYQTVSQSKGCDSGL